MIRITEELTIPEEELSFSFSRSSGPGGQNVNKVSTRVTLRFDVENSPSLTADQRELIKKRLESRITKGGVLRVSSQKHRSQSGNRASATERFAGLLAEALQISRPRKPTGVPGAAKKKRLENKKRRGRLKDLRGRPFEDE
jgi:ribosome-associated protein